MVNMLKELEKTTNKDARILMGNTEQKRGYYYANEFDYDIVDIDAPHNPEKYPAIGRWWSQIGVRLQMVSMMSTKKRILPT